MSDLFIYLLFVCFLKISKKNKKIVCHTASFHMLKESRIWRNCFVLTSKFVVKKFQDAFAGYFKTCMAGLTRPLRL